MSDLDLEECEMFAVDIARKAGKMVKETCGNIKSIEMKESVVDLVTEMDRSVEILIFSMLREKFPKHHLVGEEDVSANRGSKIELTDEPTWFIDPIDGTMNFVHTFPYVAVCLGLAVNKQPVLGVVFCPILDQMHTARKGNGAYCNGVKMNVRCVPSLKDALVCTEAGSDRSEARRECWLKNVNSVAWQSHGIRALGSGALNICSVAHGHTNVYYEFGLHCWDMCAASVILVEAGGYICDTNGEPFNMMKRRIVAACNENIAKELVKALVIQLDIPSE